jgi:hypothetical protein
LPGDPNAPYGGLGPPIPPLYSCKKLERSLKGRTDNISCFNPDFTHSSPLQTFHRAYLFKVKFKSKKSPKKSVRVQKVRKKVVLPGRHPDPGSVKADPWPDPESKSGPRWPGSGSRVRTRPRMAGSGLLFFFIFDFSFNLMPLNHEKERCRAKAKAKAKSIRTSFFFGLDVFFGVAYLFLSSNIWPFFLFHRWPKAANSDRSQRMLCPGPD